jgi:hypothetical protein
MDFLAFETRRKILLSSAAAALWALLPKSAAGPTQSMSPAKSRFITKYEIKISHLGLCIGLEHGQATQFCFMSHLFRDLDSHWFQNYNEVKAHYLQQGRLLSSERVFSKEASTVTFINTWDSEEDFINFCRSTSMAQIHTKFQSARCSPVFKLA